MDFQLGYDTLALGTYGLGSASEIDYTSARYHLFIDLDDTSDDNASILLVGRDVSAKDVLI